MTHLKHVRILSRSSDLALSQAREVGRALAARWPGLEIAYVTRDAAGDRDRSAPLAEAVDKGLFTADLSDALARGDADIVVHSWKDLPIAERRDTVVAGTLRRADPRDVLVVRREAVDRRRPALTVLTSSPRRGWQLERSLPPLLPWRLRDLRTAAVRGNVPTRLAKLVAGQADALVVAKAALDRLLDDDASAVARRVRGALDACVWMVLPISRFPTAPAQGALAIEVAARNKAMASLVREISHEPTLEACRAERAILAAHGGGCHEAIGATVLQRAYGVITSVRGQTGDGGVLDRWELSARGVAFPRADPSAIWPRPDERGGSVRRPRTTDVQLTERGVWITRAEALPEGARPTVDQLVWAAGVVTWQKLAQRGLWVNGCADGLGDEEKPAVDRLAGQSVTWQRLTHGRSGDPDATATYDVEYSWPADLGSRTHFYWTSGSAFLEALDRFPSIRQGHHASGPGRSARTVADVIGAPNRTSIWLDYEAWLASVS